MTKAGSSTLARGALVAALLVLLNCCFSFIVAQRDSDGTLTACAASWSLPCNDTSRSLASLLALGYCASSTQDQQQPLRLLIGTSWASAINSSGGDQQPASDAAYDLPDQLRQYLQQVGVQATVDLDTTWALSPTSSAGTTGSGHAAWTVAPNTIAVTSAKAQELPSHLLLSDPDLQWTDVVPAARKLAAWYGGRLMALPYSIEVPLVLYRRDALASVGANPPRTWPALVALLRKLQQQQQAHGTPGLRNGVQQEQKQQQAASFAGAGAPRAGFCNALPSGCDRDSDLFMSIWSSLALVGMQRVTNRREMEGVLANQLASPEPQSRWAASLQVYRNLMEMAPAAAGHAPCRRPSLDVALEHCAVIVAVSTTAKAALWRLGQTQGQAQRQRRRSLAAGGASGGVLLTTVLPGMPDGTCPDGRPPNAIDGCANGADSDLQHRILFLGREVRSYLINASAPPALQYVAWRAGAVTMGAANSWASVLRPVQGSATVMRTSQLSDVRPWVSYGYDEDDIGAYLAAISESLERTRLITTLQVLPQLWMPIERIMVAAANEAAFGANDTAAVAKVAVDSLRKFYTVHFTALVEVLLAQLGVSVSGFIPDLDPSTSPSGPSSSSAADHSHGSKLSKGALAGLLVSCVVGLIVLLALAGLLWARRKSTVRSALTGTGVSDRNSSAPGYGPDTTLMLTDVQDSTRLWESLPATVMDAALSLHNDAFRQLLPRFRGYECHTEGDSFVLAFHTAVEAAAFALEIQLVLLNLNWPQELLDHELCCVVRQAQPASESVDGLGPPAHASGALASGVGSRYGTSNDGALVLDGSNGVIGGGGGGSEDVMMGPSCGGSGAPLPLRGGVEAGEPGGSGALLIEPWGLQAVDEEHAAICTSEERLMNTLYMRQERNSVSRRPVGRSRTFCTLQGLQLQERSSWTADIRRNRRSEMAGGPGPPEPWVGHRSLSESRSAEPGGEGGSPQAQGLDRSYGGAGGGKPSSLVFATAAGALDTAASTVTDDSDAPEQARSSAPPAPPSRGGWAPHVPNSAHMFVGGLPWGAAGGDARFGPAAGLRWPHRGVTAGRAAGGGEIRSGPGTGTGTDSGLGSDPEADRDVLSPMGAFLTGFPWATSCVMGQYNQYHTPFVPIAAAAHHEHQQQLSQQSQASRASQSDAVSEIVYEEASLRLPQQLMSPSQQLHILPGASSSGGGGAVRLASQDTASKQLWRRSTDVSNCSNAGGNSRSLRLMRAYASTRSSAGTTPPFTGLLATLRASFDGGEGNAGGGGGGGSVGVGLIGGVEFLLRAALASHADRRSTPDDDAGLLGGGDPENASRRITPVGFRRLPRRSSASSALSAMSTSHGGGGVGAGGYMSGGLGSGVCGFGGPGSEVPLIFVGDPGDSRRRHRRGSAVRTRRVGPRAREGEEGEQDGDSSGGSGGTRASTTPRGSPRVPMRVAVSRLDSRDVEGVLDTLSSSGGRRRSDRQCDNADSGDMRGSARWRVLATPYGIRSEGLNSVEGSGVRSFDRADTPAASAAAAAVDILPGRSPRQSALQPQGRVQDGPPSPFGRARTTEASPRLSLPPAALQQARLSTDGHPSSDSPAACWHHADIPSFPGGSAGSGGGGTAAATVATADPSPCTAAPPDVTDTGEGTYRAPGPQTPAVRHPTLAQSLKVRVPGQPLETVAVDEGRPQSDPAANEGLSRLVAPSGEQQPQRQAQPSAPPLVADLQVPPEALTLCPPPAPAGARPGPGAAEPPPGADPAPLAPLWPLSNNSASLGCVTPGSLMVTTVGDLSSQTLGANRPMAVPGSGQEWGSPGSGLMDVESEEQDSGSGLLPPGALPPTPQLSSVHQHQHQHQCLHQPFLVSQAQPQTQPRAQSVADPDLSVAGLVTSRISTLSDHATDNDDASVSSFLMLDAVRSRAAVPQPEGLTGDGPEGSLAPHCASALQPTPSQPITVPADRLLALRNGIVRRVDSAMQPARAGNEMAQWLAGWPDPDPPVAQSLPTRVDVSPAAVAAAGTMTDALRGLTDLDASESRRSGPGSDVTSIGALNGSAGPGCSSGGDEVTFPPVATLTGTSVGDPWAPRLLGPSGSGSGGTSSRHVYGNVRRTCSEAHVGIGSTAVAADAAAAAAARGTEVAVAVAAPALHGCPGDSPAIRSVRRVIGRSASTGCVLASGNGAPSSSYSGASGGGSGGGGGGGSTVGTLPGPQVGGSVPSRTLLLANHHLRRSRLIASEYVQSPLGRAGGAADRDGTSDVWSADGGSPCQRSNLATGGTASGRQAQLVRRVSEQFGGGAGVTGPGSGGGGGQLLSPPGERTTTYPAPRFAILRPRRSSMDAGRYAARTAAGCTDTSPRGGGGGSGSRLERQGSRTGRPWGAAEGRLSEGRGSGASAAPAHRVPGALSPVAGLEAAVPPVGGQELDVGRCRLGYSRGGVGGLRRHQGTGMPRQRLSAPGLPYNRQQSDPLSGQPASQPALHVNTMPNTRVSQAGGGNAGPGNVTRALTLAGMAVGYSGSGTDAGAGGYGRVTPRRGLPGRAATPPPRLPGSSHSTYLRGPWGTSSGFGPPAASSGLGMANPVAPHEGGGGRMWGGLEALMDAYGGALARGPTGQSVSGFRGSLAGVNPGAVDSVTGGASALYDSRVLQDVRSSDSHGVQMVYDSVALQGLLEIGGRGSNGHTPSHRASSSVLPLMQAGDSSVGVNSLGAGGVFVGTGGYNGGGRNSNTGRLMVALGTAFRSKRISRGGASLSSAGESVNPLTSRRLPTTVYGGTTRDALRSGSSGGPSTFMEAMLQLATGVSAAGAHPGTHSSMLHGVTSTSSSAFPSSGLYPASGGPAKTLRRSISPLLLFSAGGSGGGGGGGGGGGQNRIGGGGGAMERPGHLSRSTLLQRLVGQRGSRDSDASGPAVSKSMHALNVSGPQAAVLGVAAAAAAAPSVGLTGPPSSSHVPLNAPSPLLNEALQVLKIKAAACGSNAHPYHGSFDIPAGPSSSVGGYPFSGSWSRSPMAARSVLSSGPSQNLRMVPAGAATSTSAGYGSGSMGHESDPYLAKIRRDRVVQMASQPLRRLMDGTLVHASAGSAGGIVGVGGGGGSSRLSMRYSTTSHHEPRLALPPGMWRATASEGHGDSTGIVSSCDVSPAVAFVGGAGCSSVAASVAQAAAAVGAARTSAPAAVQPPALDLAANANANAAGGEGGGGDAAVSPADARGYLHATLLPVRMTADLESVPDMMPDSPPPIEFSRASVVDDDLGPLQPPSKLLDPISNTLLRSTLLSSMTDDAPSPDVTVNHARDAGHTGTGATTAGAAAAAAAPSTTNAFPASPLTSQGGNLAVPPSLFVSTEYLIIPGFAANQESFPTTADGGVDHLAPGTSSLTRMQPAFPDRALPSGGRSSGPAGASGAGPAAATLLEAAIVQGSGTSDGAADTRTPSSAVERHTTGSVRARLWGSGARSRVAAVLPRRPGMSRMTDVGVGHGHTPVMVMTDVGGPAPPGLAPPPPAAAAEGTAAATVTVSGSPTNGSVLASGIGSGRKARAGSSSARGESGVLGRAVRLSLWMLRGLGASVSSMSSRASSSGVGAQACYVSEGGGRPSRAEAAAAGAFANGGDVAAAAAAAAAATTRPPLLLLPTHSLGQATHGSPLVGSASGTRGGMSSALESVEDSLPWPPSASFLPRPVSYIVATSGVPPGADVAAAEAAPQPLPPSGSPPLQELRSRDSFPQSLHRGLDQRSVGLLRAPTSSSAVPPQQPVPQLSTATGMAALIATDGDVRAGSGRTDSPRGPSSGRSFHQNGSAKVLERLGGSMHRRAMSHGFRQSTGGASFRTEQDGAHLSRTQELASFPSNRPSYNDSRFGPDATDGPDAPLYVTPTTTALSTCTELANQASVTSRASGASTRTSRTALPHASPSPLLATAPSASASASALAAAGGSNGGGGGAAGSGGKTSGAARRARGVRRTPTPEQLMLGLSRRLDSLVSASVGGTTGGDMPAWDAAARDSVRLRQVGASTSLVGRLGVGVVQRIAPVSKKAMASGVAMQEAVCFRGFRVRCGMHSGLEEGRDVYWVKVSGRRAYSGPAMALAKTVSDLVPGGMVVLTATTFDRLRPWPNAEALPGAIVWSRGRFRVGVGELSSAATPVADVDLYQLLCPQLLPRQPMLERKPWRGAEQVLPGVLSAPLGRLALVLVQVAGLQVLSAWNSEVTAEALQVFGSLVAEVLPAWGGFPASLDVATGTLLAAFREPALALGFMHALIDVMREADWPRELLSHELGEVLAMPLGPGGGGGGGALGGGAAGMLLPDALPSPLLGAGSTMAMAGGMAGEMGYLFRGLRLRCVADVASVRVDLGCATAAALYEARDPKAFKALRRMLAQAHMGAVLCSGRLVSEVLSGPPAALAALHELLAFAPLDVSGPKAIGTPPLALSPAPSMMLPGTRTVSSMVPTPPLSPLPLGCQPPPPTPPLHPAHGSTTPVGGRPSSIIGSAAGGGGGGALDKRGKAAAGISAAAVAAASGSVGAMPATTTRLTAKEASRSFVYQCTRRRPVRRSGMGQASGFAMVGSVGGVYGSAATGMYGTTGLTYGMAGASINGAGGSMAGQGTGGG